MTSGLDEKQIVRYLLGATSAEEEQLLEERYFTDDNYFELLATVEEELIDAYAGGEMSGDERKRFEQYFLSSPQRRQRVAFAQALLASAAQRSNVKTQGVSEQQKKWSWLLWPGLRISQPAMQTLVLAGFALFAVAGSLSIVQTQRLRDQLAGVRSEGQDLRQQIAQEHAIQQQLTAALDQERTARNRLEQTLPSSSQQKIASFVLRAGTARSSDDARPLLIRPGTDIVQLQLDLAAEGNGQYQVAVRTADDQEIWSQDNLRARRTAGGGAVDVSLPANLLVSGDYVITLRLLTPRGDIEEAGQYVFRTIKR